MHTLVMAGFAIPKTLAGNYSQGYLLCIFYLLFNPNAYGEIL